MKHILIVGGRDSSIDWPAPCPLRITLIQTQANLTPKQTLAADKVIIIDELDEDDIFSIAERQHQHVPFIAVVSFEECWLSLASRIGEMLHIIHNPLNAVLRTQNKAALRKILPAQYNCDFAEINSYAELQAFVATHPHCVLKPLAGSGSVNVCEIQQGAIPPHLLQQRLNRYIVEEYLAGTEYSLETLSIDGQHQLMGVTHKLTTGTPHHIELGHDFPAKLDASLHQRLTQVSTKLLQCCQHRWGPCHIEVKIEGAQIKVVEMQTRIGGDQIWEMVHLVTGVHLPQATILAMMKLPIVINAPTYERMAIRFFQFNRKLSFLQEILPRPYQLCRLHYQPQNFNKPVHQSADRHGYMLFAIQQESGQ